VFLVPYFVSKHLTYGGVINIIIIIITIIIIYSFVTIIFVVEYLRLFNPLMSSGYFIYHEAQYSKIQRSTHTLCLCFVRISEKTAIISLYNIN
jgi:hypothetical protein